MSQLLTLSRAARLIGVTRGVLQQRIKDGELRSFDGMVNADDLLLAYPDTKFEEDLLFEHLTQIKEESYAKRVRERILPSKDVLAARLYAQSRELADVRTHLQRYHSIIVRMQDRLHVMNKSAPAMTELEAWLNRQLEEVLDTEPPNPLAVMDDYLSVVATHVELRPSGHEFFVEGADTILEAALRSGLALNYGCGNGNCGLCKARIVSGQTKKVRHHDYVLSEAEKNMGYALMCSHAPVSDLIIEALEASGPSDIPLQEIVARVKTVQPLTDTIMLLHLQTPRTNRLRFLAGQSVTLSIGDSDEADYAVASCPCDDRNLQFHIPNIPGNEFSQHVFNGLKSGDTVTVNGPSGEFVLHEDSPRPLLFIACDDGFAPIKSLLEHAMAVDTAEQMHLYWIATKAEGHYMQNLCRSWSDALDNFKFTPLVAEDEPEKAFETALQTIVNAHPEGLGQFDLYLAGSQQFVAEAREWLTQHGVSQAQLLTGEV
jgi:CDP-4-dehydro-6-deoxyglucose reductase